MEVLNLILSLLSATLCLGYVALMAVWRWAWGRVEFQQTNQVKHLVEPIAHEQSGALVSPFNKTSISILIAARNEEVLLPATLKAVMSQNYPKHLYEVIVIDDHSSDNTVAVIESFADQGVRLISLKGFDKLNSYKKFAIQKGIEAAQGDLIVCTDADVEMGEEWLKSIATAYEQFGWNMISSPVTYFKEKSLFERFQSLEFILLNAIGASNFGLGKVGSCNGANLAYEKKAFYEVGGFQGIDHLASGDDELLLHKMAARFPARQGYLMQKEAIVYTYAKPTWSEFIQQRKRWASKTTSYQDAWMKYSSIWIWLFNLSLSICFVFGLWQLIQGNDFVIWMFCMQFVLKLGFETIFIISPLSFFKRSKLLILEGILSFCHIFYLVYIGLVGNNSTYQWKGRTVK